MSWSDPCYDCGEHRADCTCKKSKEKQIKIKIESKEINKFLGKLNDAEKIFLKHTLEFSNSIRHLIKDNEWLKKEMFCEKMGISEAEYYDFISGNRNYDLMDVAKINALHEECEHHNIKKKK